uniref:Uncharacterized protein n=1 Tax=viral metagenome TaxID=1070528 RepID=A0A6C0CBG2_9ZZZZ
MDDTDKKRYNTNYQKKLDVVRKANLNIFVGE